MSSLLIAACSAHAQTDATALVGQLSSAFSGGKYVSAVQLAGSATWYAGSDVNEGTVSLTANADGSASLTLAMNKWTRQEQQTAFGAGRSCTWVGTDGISHKLEDMSCWIAQQWFLPQIVLQNSHIPATIGVELYTPSTGGLGLLSEAIVGPAGTSSSVTSLIQQASAARLALDGATFQPSTLDFTLPPSSGSASPLQVEIRYSNYKQFSGLTLATHIERYINGSLQIAIDLAQALPQS